jgi:solute carrier family 35 protein F5
MLRKKVDTEDKLDIPMFFGETFHNCVVLLCYVQIAGFVGLFCFILLWPGLYALHAFNLEVFYPLPTRTQLAYIAVNGLIGTVLSEYLWLW